MSDAQPHIGSRLCQAVACSYALATCRTRASPQCGPMICRPMGKPASVNPQGTEIAGNPQTLMGRVFRSRSSSRGRRRSGFSFSSAIAGAAIGVVGSDQHIHIRENRRDFAARLFQFAAASEHNVRAHVLTGTNPAQGFRLVEFRAAGDEIGMKGIRLRALQRPVSRHGQFQVAYLRAHGSQACNRVIDGGGHLGVQICQRRISSASRCAAAGEFFPVPPHNLRPEHSRWSCPQRRSRQWRRKSRPRPPPFVRSVPRDREKVKAESRPGC